MDVIIHTYGRAKRELQHTLTALANEDIRPLLVVQEREKNEYDGFPAIVYVLPDHIRTLAHTRDHIIHDMPGDDHVVFMDDDLRFAVRREDDRSKFRPPQPGDLQNMLRAIDLSLLNCPMVGIGAREGGNRVTEPYVENSRIMRVLAFRRSYLREHCMTFSPLVVMEDFHINLQILRSGGRTCICNDWVSDQVGGSDAPGGCSVYRTPQVQTDSANLLAKLHPGFVKVVEKKGWQGQGTRTDVMVYWKKAYASSQRS